MATPTTSVARFNALLGFLKQDTDAAIALSKDVQFINVPGGSTSGNRYEARPMFDTVLHMDESKARQLQEHILQLEAMERICKNTREKLEKTIYHPQKGQNGQNPFKGNQVMDSGVIGDKDRIEMAARMEEYLRDLAKKPGNGIRIKSRKYDYLRARHAEAFLHAPDTPRPPADLYVHLEHLGMDEKNMWCERHTAFDGFYPKNNCQACYYVQQWWTQVKQQPVEGDADMLRALNAVP